MKMAISLKRNKRIVGFEIMIMLTISSLFFFGMVGISSSSDDFVTKDNNANGDDDLVTVSSSNYTNFTVSSSNYTNFTVSSSNYTNVSVRTTTDDDDGDVSHQLPPAAFVNNKIEHRSRLWEKRQNELKAKEIKEKRHKVKNRIEYSYSLLEERTKLLKAKEIREEHNETEGMIPVKKPSHGRFIKNGAYNTYLVILGIFFGIVVSNHSVPKDVFVKHALVAFMFLFLSFSIKYLVKIKKVDGKIVSPSWYQGLKISFYIAMTASPLIMAHTLCIPWYSLEGIRGGLWNIVKAIAGGLWNIVKVTGGGLWNIAKAMGRGLWNIVQAIGEGQSTEYCSSDQRGVNIDAGFTFFMV